MGMRTREQKEPTLPKDVKKLLRGKDIVSSSAESPPVLQQTLRLAEKESGRKPFSVGSLLEALQILGKTPEKAKPIFEAQAPEVFAEWTKKGERLASEAEFTRNYVDGQMESYREYLKTHPLPRK